jgi:uncharacterized protein (TIGR02444 family)
VTTFPDNPFWNFSLTVYDRPGVAEACLRLQDRHGLDVNLLLVCCWAGAQGRGLDSAGIARLAAAVTDWHHAVVQPLRGVRRWLKTQAAAPAGLAGALRTAIKGKELEAERIEQQLLYDALGGPAADTASLCEEDALAAKNLRLYLEVSGLEPDAVDTAALAALLQGAFPSLTEDAAQSLLA